MLTGLLTASKKQMTFQVESYVAHSGIHNGLPTTSNEKYKIAFKGRIQRKGAPWIRLLFNQASLSLNSFIIITSVEDKAQQKLNSVTLSQWNNTSAYFNGDAVDVELHVAAGDSNVFFDVNEVMIGNRDKNNNSSNASSICGGDNRVFTVDERVGRLWPGGGTAWVTSTGVLVTAGHLRDDGITSIEFNVPFSDPEGTPRHSQPRDQYIVNQNTWIYSNNGEGDDWAVFNVYNNTQTGKHPIDNWLGGFVVVQDLTPSQIRITGYGVDGPAPHFGAGATDKNEHNQIEQTNVGPNAGSSGSILRYTVDTQSLNSGSPVIDESTGHAIGVHTNSNCENGHNIGTSAYNTSFWNAIHQSVNIVVDQKLIDNSTQIGSINRWISGSFNTQLTLGQPFESNAGRTELLKADQSIQNGQKYNNWSIGTSVESDVSNHHSFFILPSISSISSNFKPVSTTIIIQNQVDGLNNGKVYFKDPWLIDYADPFYGNSLRNLGMSAFFKERSSPFSPDYSTSYNGDVYKGIFLNQNLTFDPYVPIYSINTITNTNFSTYFLNWSVFSGQADFGNADLQETDVVFKQENTVITANYKGHLRSNHPDLANAKNQRRLVSYGNSWVMVYESMGDIWITYSVDAGVTWVQEKRLNTLIGEAKNPTISNAIALSHYSNSPDHAIVSWVEGSGTIHLQTMKIASGADFPVHLGWDFYAQQQNSINHRILNDFSIPSTHSSGRPSIALLSNYNNFICTIAFEKGTYDGIRVAQLLFEGSGESVEDLDGASVISAIPLQKSISISSHASDNCPVVISYPYAYGFSGKTFVYYLAGGYASGLRIAGYDYGTQTTQLLQTAYGDYTYSSLQGAVNPLGASFALVAEAYNNGMQTVNVYSKATYYSTAYLNTTYTNMSQPSVMVERNGSVGSPTVSIVMKSISDNYFYQSNGTSTVTMIETGVASVFTRERKMPGELELMLIKNTMSPASIEKFPYSVEKDMAKISITNIPTEVKAIFTRSNSEGQRISAVLDFSGSNVRFMDTLQNSNRISTITTSNFETIVRQSDTLRVPVGVEVIRNENTIRSYAPSHWSALSKQSVGGLQTNDILRFTVGKSNTDVQWYANVRIDGVSLNSDKLTNGATLIPTEINVIAYPSTFNPTTTFRLSLPYSGHIQLSVFNILGQKMATVIDGEMPAGYSEIRFDGMTLSSGIYLYRLEAQNIVRSGKILLLK